MTKLLRLIILLLLILVLLFAGYEIGKYFNRNSTQTQVIENYSFVKEIAELATLEANGVTTFTSSNITNDGSWTDALKKTFAEKTIHITMPYTAKYGINLQDSNMHIVRKDSVVEIHLPQPQLLSLELRVDRMDATNRKGWALFQDDATYIPYQKKLYAQSRAQLEQNAIYLGKSRERACSLLENYFRTLKLRAVCIFDQPATTVTWPKG